MFAISRSEIRRLLNAVDLKKNPFGKRDYLLILFLYNTGLRVGEGSGVITHLVAKDGEPRQYLHLPAALCDAQRVL